MTSIRAFERSRRVALAAGAALVFAAAAPAYAGNPCKSEDPLDFDDANRRVDCDDADKPGWGTYDYDKERQRVPDGPASHAGGDASSYDYLPTTLSGWFDSLAPADRRQFTARLIQEAGIGDRQLSQHEIDSLLTLVTGEIDSYFASEGLTADQRRKAIAEIAVESGVGLRGDGKRELSPDDAIFGSDRRRFGDADYNDFGSGRVDPTDPADPLAGFGAPDDDSLESDLDLGDF